MTEDGVWRTIGLHAAVGIRAGRVAAIYAIVAGEAGAVGRFRAVELLRTGNVLRGAIVGLHSRMSVTVLRIPLCFREARLAARQLIIVELVIEGGAAVVAADVARVLMSISLIAG